MAGDFAKSPFSGDSPVALYLTLRCLFRSRVLLPLQCIVSDRAINVLGLEIHLVGANPRSDGSLRNSHHQDAWIAAHHAVIDGDTGDLRRNLLLGHRG